MEDNNKYGDKIIAWHEGRISPEEQSELLTEMERNPAFRREVQEYKTMMDALEETRAEAHRKKLQGIEAQLEQAGFFEQKPIKVSFFARFRPLMAMAAAFIGVLAMIGWWWLGDQRHRKSAAELAQVTLQRETIPTPSTSGAMGDTARDTLHALTRKSQFDKAAAGWHNILKDNPNSPEAQFYFAVNTLKSGKKDDMAHAIRELERLLRPQAGLSIAPIDPADAEWYLALAYLADHRPKNAIPLLKKLAPNKPKAAGLLQQLQK